MTSERAPPTAAHWRRHKLVAVAEGHVPSAAAARVRTAARLLTLA